LLQLSKYYLVSHNVFTFANLVKQVIGDTLVCVSDNASVRQSVTVIQHALTTAASHNQAMVQEASGLTALQYEWFLQSAKYRSTKCWRALF